VILIFGFGILREGFGLESWKKRRTRLRETVVVAIARWMMECEKLNRILTTGLVSDVHVTPGE
jgi:hypothetical protein